MADAAVVDFLNKLTADPELRATAKSTYQSEGLDGLAKLASEQGDDVTPAALEEVISPASIGTDTSIGWS
jgi:hypothetical protein